MTKELLPNNSFKPKLLRSGNGVAEKACHAVTCATQFGLTQALGGLMYDYAPIDIKCPHCGQLANFLEPFAFASEPPLQPDVRWHRWGSWIVIEKYPNEFAWKPPSGSDQYLRGGGSKVHGGYPVLTNGLAHCSSCFVHKKHELRVPQDLWWQWSIRGDVLYAFDREHALHILEYIKSTKRPARPQSSALGKLPTVFLKADVRDRITTTIQKSLAAAT